MTDYHAPLTPLEIFAANRDLALAEAERCDIGGWASAMNYAYGQAQAYGEAIRILSRPAPVDQFRCSFTYPMSGDDCADAGNLVTPDGLRWCVFHAPNFARLTISEHDDQRESK